MQTIYEVQTDPITTAMTLALKVSTSEVHMRLRWTPFKADPVLEPLENNTPHDKDHREEHYPQKLDNNEYLLNFK